MEDNERIFVDENETCQIDFSSAIWATDKLHQIFSVLDDGILNDVDFVVETEKELIFIEYKNATHKKVVNPEAFNPLSEKNKRRIPKKYYDSLNFIQSTGRGVGKSKIYICIFEAKLSDPNTGDFIRNELMNRLPFKLKEKSILHGIDLKESMIDDFCVLNISQWNERYKQFPAKILEI